MSDDNPISSLALSVSRYYSMQKMAAPQLCKAGVLLLFHHRGNEPYRWAGHKGTHRKLIDFFTAREGHITKVIRFSSDCFETDEDAHGNKLVTAMRAFEKAYVDETPPPPVVEYVPHDNDRFDKPRPIRRAELQVLLEQTKRFLELTQITRDAGKVRKKIKRKGISQKRAGPDSKDSVLSQLNESER